jgi:hypothetical protein
MKIASVIQRAPDAFSVWASYYKDYEFNDWNLYAWQNLPDAALADWRSTVLDQFGPVPQDVLQKIQLKTGPDLAYIVNYFKGIVKSGKDSERRSREKVNLGPINIDLPIAFILLTFPILYLGSSALFRAMETQRTLIAIDIAKIERDIAASTGAGPLRYVPEPETLKRSPYYLIAQRRYRELFQLFRAFLLIVHPAL